MAKDVLLGKLEKMAELTVAEQDRPVRRDGESSLFHGLDDQPVDLLRPGERENLIAALTRNDDGVDLSFADGP